MYKIRNIDKDKVLKLLELSRIYWIQANIPKKLSMSFHNFPQLSLNPSYNHNSDITTTNFSGIDKNKDTCMFYITLKKGPGIPSFGNIKYHKESDFSMPILYPSSIGEFLLLEIDRINKSDESIEILHHYIMPENIHMIVSIKNDKLDFLSASIKMLIDRLQHSAVVERLINISDKLLQEGFDYKHISDETIYNKTIKYVRTKPIVHTLIQEDPDIFTKLNWINIDGTICQLFGNVTFLFNPFKYLVSIPKNNSVYDKDSNLKNWKHAADNGGVLVGSFISSDEKIFLKDIWETSARIILINQTPIKDGHFPAHHFLKRCRDRNLLIMIPYPPDYITRTEISIDQYDLYRKFLNDFAEKVVSI